MDKFVPTKIEGRDDNLIVKSNTLMEAKFQFKLWELRIFEKMVSLIQKGDKAFRPSKIYVTDLIKYFKGNSGNDYSLIRDAAMSLADKRLYISYTSSNGSKRWAKISVFPTVTIPNDDDRGGENAYIELEFHNDLKPYLLDLKARFKAYDMRNIQPLTSVYSIRMYILLKQFEFIGQRTFEVDTLKELLGVDANQYKLYGDFKRRVINRPQKDLKKYCDICFDFKEEKRGRKVHKIHFKISKNIPTKNKALVEAKTRKTEEQATQNELFDTQQVELSSSQAQILDVVKDWGVNRVTLLECLEKRSEAHIWDCIHQTQQAKNVENEGAYFLKLVQMEMVVTPKAAKVKKQTKKKQAVQTQVQERKQYEQRLKQLQQQKYEAKQALALKLLHQETSLKSSIIEALSTRRFVKYDVNVSLEENMKLKSVQGALITLLEEWRGEHFEPINKKYDKAIQQLKTTYSQDG